MSSEETAQDTSKETQETSPGAPDLGPVTREEFDALATHAKTLTAALGEAGKRLAVIDKVAEMLQGKPEQSLTKEEKLVVEELHRLIPGLKHLEDIPKVQQVVHDAAKANSDTLISAAFEYQLNLQREAGLPIDNPESNYYISAVVKEWINRDASRQARFWRGDRSVIKEGFDEVKTTLIDPLRSGTLGKSPSPSPTSVLKHRPRNAAPAGTPGLGEPAKALDYSNPKAVREALKAALAS